eukprot:gnl/TRDRNA2_/TRDRNA2_174444_c5_seq21.p1 gnl/TRDRNA2_/TRDRNA2_174444_c5~~gnl/TRDRNA2_/TRDRNA2_174444_c5_seq21.p1  ORF type:complete len:465 (+),score=169.28 gnl/TRDRNA2_/TRDRNA2_174444_c5_seq21:119-1396(+)
MDHAKADKSEAEETKGTAEGDLAMATKDLATQSKNLETTSTDCMTGATDHETSLKGRADELKALATAKKIIEDSTSGAVGQSYSLLQLAEQAKITTRADLAKLEVVTAIKRLAKQQHSAALSQLASRVSAAVRMGSMSGDDVFAKIKSLITGMIEKLQKEAAEAADLKAYCDEETAKSDEKKTELTENLDKLSAKIDKATAGSADLKEKVAETQKQLAALAKMQAEMDKARMDENAAYKEAKADLEQGIKGVQGAIQVLRDYYGSASLLQQPAPTVATHSASGDAGGSIISMLEVAESDFTKNLAQVNMEEEDAQSTYDESTQENKVTKTMKEQDAKYAAAEAKGLDKTVAELSSDLTGAQTELDAVLEYRTKLDEQCVAKPETYEERKERREAEIKGLKEAMTILEEEAAFLQRPRRFRHVMAH